MGKTADADAAPQLLPTILGMKVNEDSFQCHAMQRVIGLRIHGAPFFGPIIPPKALHVKAPFSRPLLQCHRLLRTKASKGEDIASKARAFYRSLPHLAPQDFVEYFSVFEGFLPPLKDVNLPIREAIDTLIFNHLDALRPRMEGGLSPQAKAVLMRLAKGDRKMHSITKKESISQLQGRSIYKQLFEAGLIQKEKSRELPLKTHPKQRLKKSLRHYQVEDKIHFSSQFARFWFTFVAPHVDLASMQRHLDFGFESYVSLAFELLSQSLLFHDLAPLEVVHKGSYWDKRHEIDLLLEVEDGRIIAGESKWKNRKVCKNILNALERKCDRAALHVTHFVLFSKSGFSKELERSQDARVWLYDLSEFERLRDD